MSEWKVTAEHNWVLASDETDARARIEDDDWHERDHPVDRKGGGDTPTITVRTVCPVTKKARWCGSTHECPGGRERTFTQIWEPHESHREEDNELVATWGFGAGADAEIPPMWVEVTDEDN